MTTTRTMNIILKIIVESINLTFFFKNKIRYESEFYQIYFLQKIKVMNLFLLSLCVNTLAYLHCDKHIVKMCLETTQMLYTAHHILKSDVLEKAPKTKQGGVYRKTHVNHPINIWVRTYDKNYIFTCQIGLALCKEYTRRYQKTHSVEKHILWLSDNIPKNIECSDSISVMPQAMPDLYKCDALTNKDVVKAYKRYYIFEKLKFAKWKFIDERGDPAKILCIQSLTVLELRNIVEKKKLIDHKKYIKKAELIKILNE